jgi:endoglucanase
MQRKKAVLILIAALAAADLALAAPAVAPAPAGSPVALHGKLAVDKGKLVDQAGKAVQLRGMSTMGLQWTGDFVNDAAFEALAKDWKADVVRLAMYVGEGGYAADPSVKDILVKGLDLAIAKGLYAIVDWHVLTPGDPNDPLYSGVDAFFKDIATRYAAYPNVIYEIANEPNGSAVNWKKNIKPYAERLVGLIRSIDPDNLIVIGTGRWSQDVDFAADDPVAGKNLAYAIHFYAGTHGAILRGKVQDALAKGACVICTEWGTSKADGSGGNFFPASDTWLKLFDDAGISWLNWSLSSANETSAAFRPGINPEPELGPDGYPAWEPEALSPSGAYVRAKLRGEAPPAAK